MKIKQWVGTFSFAAIVLGSLAIGCGSTTYAEACEEEDACGKKPSAEEVTACKNALVKGCEDEADDFASCADGNMECVQGETKIKSGECAEEFAKYTACAQSKQQATGNGG